MRCFIVFIVIFMNCSGLWFNCLMNHFISAFCRIFVIRILREKTLDTRQKILYATLPPTPDSLPPNKQTHFPYSRNQHLWHWQCKSLIFATQMFIFITKLLILLNLSPLVIHFFYVKERHLKENFLLKSYIIASMGVIEFRVKIRIRK